MKAVFDMGLGLYPGWPLDSSCLTRLTFLKDLGIKFVQLPFPYNNSEITLYKSFVERVIDLQLKPLFHSPTTKFFAFNEFLQVKQHSNYVKNQIEEVCKVISNLGICNSSIVIHGGSGKKSEPDLLNNTKVVLKLITSIISEFEIDCKVLLENVEPKVEKIRIGSKKSHFDSLLPTLSNEMSGICWDIGHFWLAEGRDKIPNLNKDLVNKIRLIHIHNVNEFGQGHVPFSRLSDNLISSLKWLIDNEINAPIIIEILPNRIPGMVKIEDMFAKQLEIISEAVEKATQ